VHNISSNRKTRDKLLSLPLTLSDYQSICRNHSYTLIEELRAKLLNLESQLVRSDNASVKLGEKCVQLYRAFSFCDLPQSPVKQSFDETTRHFGGNSIFYGFLQDPSNYIEGSILPMDPHSVMIIYLPFPSSKLKAVCSPDVSSHRATAFASEFVRTWQDILIKTAKTQLICR
jgi:hypothetical protein